MYCMKTSRKRQVKNNVFEKERVLCLLFFHSVFQCLQYLIVHISSVTIHSWRRLSNRRKEKEHEKND